MNDPYNPSILLMTTKHIIIHRINVPINSTSIFLVRLEVIKNSGRAINKLMLLISHENK